MDDGWSKRKRPERAFPRAACTVGEHVRGAFRDVRLAVSFFRLAQDSGLFTVRDNIFKITK